MTKRIDMILKQKNYWLEKQHQLITRISIASYEGDHDRYEQLLQDFETAAIIIWRFDEKLRDEQQRTVTYPVDLDGELASLCDEDL